MQMKFTGISNINLRFQAVFIRFLQGFPDLFLAVVVLCTAKFYGRTKLLTIC